VIFEEDYGVGPRWEYAKVDQPMICIGEVGTKASGFTIAIVYCYDDAQSVRSPELRSMARIVPAGAIEGVEDFHVDGIAGGGIGWADPDCRECIAPG
jgi:hypothetical protein